MKKIIVFLLCVLMTAANFAPVEAAQLDLSLYSNYAVALDMDTGVILAGKNDHEKMYPASITKIITVAVSLPLIDDLDATTIITARDLETIYETGASSAYFVEGETVTYRDLILGALIPSGADACRALGFNLFGSQEAIVAQMNELVASLNLSDSHFTNTTGIHDENHYSSAYDMAVLLSYASSLAGFDELFSLNKATSSNGLHTWYKRVVYNAINAGIDTSTLLGCKSGYTEAASHTLASITQANNHEIAVVVAQAGKTDTQHSPTMADTMNLTDYVKSHFSDVKVIQTNQEMTWGDVVDGKQAKTSLLAKSEAIAILPEDYLDKLELIYQISELEAPLTTNQSAGKVVVSYDGIMLQEVELLVGDAIERDHIAYFIHHPWELFFPYVTAFLLSGAFVTLLVLSHRLKNKRKKNYLG